MNRIDNLKSLQLIILRTVVNAPCYIRNGDLRKLREM